MEKAIEFVLERIGYSEKFCELNLSIDDVKELFEICLMHSYFTFNAEFYRQKFGLPMGSILLPLLADIFMQNYIQENINIITSEQKSLSCDSEIK